MSFNITIGRYGGFYIHRGNTFSICLGWIAFTFMKMELEDFADKQFEAGMYRGYELGLKAIRRDVQEHPDWYMDDPLRKFFVRVDYLLNDSKP